MPLLHLLADETICKNLSPSSLHSDADDLSFYPKKSVDSFGVEKRAKAMPAAESFRGTFPSCRLCLQFMASIVCLCEPQFGVPATVDRLCGVEAKQRWGDFSATELSLYYRTASDGCGKAKENDILYPQRRRFLH